MSIYLIIACNGYFGLYVIKNISEHIEDMVIAIMRFNRSLENIVYNRGD